MSLSETMARGLGEQLRLAVLQLLRSMPGYRAADALLSPALDAMGLPHTRDQLRTHLGWLAEQDLVQLEQNGAATIAHLKIRGIDVAKGLAEVAGVARPQPGD